MEKQQDVIVLITEGEFISPTYFRTLFTEPLKPLCQLGNQDPHIQIREKSLREVKTLVIQ